MKFWIVTPSYNQLNWLKKAVASVADQSCPGIAIHHHIQDARSKDGTAEFLENHKAASQRTPNYSFSYSSESDGGMYDAINKGWEKCPEGYEMISYLNCDEQYLAGHFKRLAEVVLKRPDVDVFFGDALIVDSVGKFIAYRKGMPPTRAHSLVSGTKAFVTCSSFVRWKSWNANRLVFDTKWRDLGDIAWGMKMIDKKIAMSELGFPTTTFTDTGENMNMAPNALREKKEFRMYAPAWMRACAGFFILQYRLKKFFHGGYFVKPFSYEIFTVESNKSRVPFKVEKVSPFWLSRWGL